MTVSETIAWQWEGYSKFHENKGNLLIHIFAVGLFWAGTIGLVLGAIRLSLFASAVSVFVLLISLILQSVGHKREANATIPFAGKADFFKRFLCEQFFTFPRFVLTGGWFRNFFGK